MKSYVTIGLLLLCSWAWAQPNADSSELAEFFQPLKYRNIGPFRGGRSVTATGVAGDPLTYYMGTTGGGVWKTTDAGQHWKNISDGYFGTGSVGAVAVSRSNPRVVYVGMGEHAPRGVMTSHGDGVYKSTDGGKSWRHLGLENTQHISRVLVHPDNPDLVYVAAQGQLYGGNEERGVYRSTDGGESWEKLLFVNDLTGAVELSLNRSNPRELYAAMWHHQRLPWQVVSGGPGSGLYKSIDGGDTWEEMTDGLPEEMGKMAVAVAQSNTDKVYALIESDSNADKGGLFVSEDAGASWTRVSDDNRLTQRAWYYTEVFVDPTNENVVYVLSADALRSIDGGKTWEEISGTHGDYHDLWINPNNPRNLCIANDGGAAISFDYGESWSTQDNMPTGQFYRINVDNQYPYRIYGGQQDNTSVAIASMSPGSSGIARQDWSPSAGGESAFLAFDPDNPRYVLGGSYLGTIEVLDNEAKASTNIMAAPIQYLGREARDMKYRFNWNAPIIRSRHEPNTFYHASQILLRTRDMGKSWEEVSPDLTRNQDDKLGPGGGPYTNEAVGAENYGTISYVTDSPHEAGVIWVGTDDGKVQLTRNGGDSWEDVTPEGQGETLVNAIDVSPHDPGTAFIATTRYKFNDHRPRLLKTTNSGKAWTEITGDLPAGAYTRVVRQDTEREDLLFAGTEAGLFASFDGGEHWQRFNLNLPVTPITDLLVAHDDLIVATSGRAFWILDDLELVRQYDGTPRSVQLYTPAPVILGNHRSQMDRSQATFDGTDLLEGVNPASGAVIYYTLPPNQDSATVTLTITDQAGKVVREFTSDQPAAETYAGGPPAPTELPAAAGLNRFVWDLRHGSLTGAPAAYIEGSFRGRRVGPGTYSAKLTVGTTSETAQVLVQPNPTYDLTPEAYVDYDAFMSEAEGNFNEMHGMVNELHAINQQLGRLTTKLEEEGHTELLAKARDLQSEVTNWDDLMIQRKSKAYDDVENFPNRFTANYLFVLNHAESGLPRVNDATRERLELLNQEWQQLKVKGDQLLNERVPAFNRQLWEANIGAIWLE
ncbi:sortilin (neurotensin receptor 3) [Neolewinella xylanilytica]|uniref:Sortilin (Neurotensin receptor 3) n=1 Tax=Neolewinella xylanilytica TaxID=1514080 RepID=A0A2S6I3Z6_9BACT|nr:glycosyl hydrolase [Neolewinella xylanilytica]PPK85904.1 sortilin (neurotensin receptor 3) [Neolewinella xylanilytica]